MRKITIIAAMFIVALSSCKKDNNTSDESQVIEFVSESIATRVNTQGDEWTQGDQIGVYMIDEAASMVYSNYQYEALTGGESTTRFVPVDDDNALEYGEDKMAFRAYYPYNSETLTTADATGTEIDCSDQTKADFLWAENLEAYRGDLISLPFEHKMSRLELVITPMENISWLNGLEASIVGVLTTGECTNIENGEVVGLSGEDVELTFTTQEYVIDSQSDSGYSLSEVGDIIDMVSATVIFFPQQLTNAATITLTLDDRVFSLSLPAAEEFLSGKQHQYKVKLGNDYIEFAGGNTISEWGDTEYGSDLNGGYVSNN